MSEPSLDHPLELPEYDPATEWESDEKTPTTPVEKMEELMESLRSNGVPTESSLRVTKPIRSAALRSAVEGSRQP